MADNAKDVASHYNARPQVSAKDRTKSPIIHLKLINNYVKSVLIRKYTPPKARAFDICCGKGGDLLKFKKCNVSSLVGVDLAEISIEHAKSRYAEGRFNFDANFFAYDCFQVRLKDVLPRHLTEKKFQIVSNQFALHYAFESEAKIRQLLQNVSDMLETGGHYVGTIPDAYWIVKKLRSIEGLEFGNDVYKIRFEQKDDYPMYGHKYWFNLEDAISDCPEYLVYFPELERLAREYKLKLVKKQKFHEFVQKYYYEEMLQRMRVFGDDNKQKVPEDQWEAIGIYMVFSFIKE